mmetsp:Transcript_15746/g.26283  ORF Transcript_15746/g.26283 Transcript_15746/m.26283 type:complete len:256 (-) Transcript_15746:19-786(-)
MACPLPFPTAPVPTCPDACCSCRWRTAPWGSTCVPRLPVIAPAWPVAGCRSLLSTPGASFGRAMCSRPAMACRWSGWAWRLPSRCWCKAHLATWWCCETTPPPSPPCCPPLPLPLPLKRPPDVLPRLPRDQPTMTSLLEVPPLRPAPPSSSSLSIPLICPAEGFTCIGCGEPTHRPSLSRASSPPTRSTCVARPRGPQTEPPSTTSQAWTEGEPLASSYNAPLQKVCTLGSGSGRSTGVVTARVAHIGFIACKQS